MPQPLPFRADPAPPPPGLHPGDGQAPHDAAREGQFARLRQVEHDTEEPRSHGAELADQMTDQLRALIRHTIGAAPWVQGAWPCRVLSVEDRPRRRCTVQLVESGGVISNVQADPTLPTIGNQYAVRRTVRLNPAATHGLPEEVHWTLKVAAGRALYRKESGAAALLRYGWPPPTVPADWAVETVNDHLPLPPVLFGAATSPAGDREVVLQAPVSRASWRRDGSVYNTPITSGNRYTHYAGTGAGDQTQAYLPQPPYTDPWAIADDGYNTVGAHTRFQGTVVPAGTHFAAVLSPGSEFTCCQPLFGEPFCVGLTNTTIGSVAITGIVQTADDFAASVLDQGTLGQFTVFNYYTYPAVVVTEHFSDPITVAHSQRIPSGGCHFDYFGGAPIALRFDSITEVDDSLTLPPDVTYRKDQARTPRYGTVAANAWTRDGVACGAWLVTGVDATHLSPVALSVQLVGDHLPGADLPLLDPVEGVGGPWLSLSPEGQLTVWASNPANDYYTWTPTHTWRRVVTLGTAGLIGILVMSADGQDVIGRTNEGHSRTVWTADGGATWALLPALPDGAQPWFNGAMRFIDG